MAQKPEEGGGARAWRVMATTQKEVTANLGSGWRDPPVCWQGLETVSLASPRKVTEVIQVRDSDHLGPAGSTGKGRR